MQNPVSIWKQERFFALAVVMVRFLFTAYRALTQSIVHDEAFNYLTFLQGPWSDLYLKYDANHHILYTILARCSIALFGNSEFALRFPSILSGLALSCGIFVVLQPLRSRAVRWFAFLLVLLHPLLLDFSVAARGYGLSLALLVWAIYGVQQRYYLVSGILLGLAVSANFAVAFPVIAIVLSAALLSRDSITGLKLLIPAITVFTMVCYLPLRFATRGNFYVGAPTFYDSVLSLVKFSIRTTVFGQEGLFGTDGATNSIVKVILPALSFLILISMRKHRSMMGWFPLCVLASSVIGLIIANHWLGVLYPADRSGLWLSLLFILVWAFAADQESNRPLLGVYALLAGLLIAQFVTQLQGKYFIIWNFDQNTKLFATKLQSMTQSNAAGSIQVSVSEAQHPSLEYYRLRMGLAAVQPLVRRAAPVPLTGHDYYVLTWPDLNNPEVARLNVLLRDAPTGVIFATEPDSAQKK